MLLKEFALGHSNLFNTNHDNHADALTEPQPQPSPYQPPPSHSKKIFLGLGAGAIVTIVLLVILGSIGGVVIFQAAQQGAQQPNIQVTAVSIPQATGDPQTAYPVDGIVSSSDSFDYTPSQPGTYTLVFDNSFSTFSSKSISLSYTAGGSSDTKSFVVDAGEIERLSFTLEANQRLSGSFTISGGSGNDVNFYMKAETCTQTVNFSFTLVNSGSANGYATIQFQVDGQSYWTNKYFVVQGQQLPQSGSIVLSDCNGHDYRVVVSSIEKA